MGASAYFLAGGERKGEREGGRENKASVTAARREWAARAAAGGIKRDYWTILSAIYETDMFRRRPPSRGRAQGPLHSCYMAEEGRGRGEKGGGRGSLSGLRAVY